MMRVEPEIVELLDEMICTAPGCYLRYGEHAPEETTACIERELLASEAER